MVAFEAKDAASKILHSTFHRSFARRHPQAGKGFVPWVIAQPPKSAIACDLRREGFQIIVRIEWEWTRNQPTNRLINYLYIRRLQELRRFVVR